MYEEDEYSKFTRNLSKLINSQWSKVKRNSSKNLNCPNNLDQVLEEEYETLLKEIDYLTTGKQCFLSFKNDNFTKAKSSDDLSKMLTKHSSEVLKTYIEKHDSKPLNKRKIDDNSARQDILNYVTEIVLSRNKCNNKLCSCKPVKLSKEVLTDNTTSEDNGKEVQTENASDYYSEKSTDATPTKSQKSVQITPEVKQQKSTEKNEFKGASVQTEDCTIDPNCICCSKDENNKTAKTDEKLIKDASTSDRRLTASKNIFANCAGQSVGAATSTTNRFCVPKNFENIIENNQYGNSFSTCAKKTDCACTAYDAKEAIKRGLVLPSSDICLQNKVVKIFKKEKDKAKKNSTKYDTSATSSSTKVTKKEKEKKKNKKRVSSSSDNALSDVTSASTNKKGKSKQKEKKKKNNGKKKKENSEDASTPETTFRTKQKKEPTTGCFTRKKKTKCDESCQGVQQQKSMQTIPIRTSDKNDQIFLYGANDRKAVQTSTDSEVATQANEDKLNKKPTEDKETIYKADKEKEYKEKHSGTETNAKNSSHNIKNGRDRSKSGDKDATYKDKRSRTDVKSDNRTERDRDKSGGNLVCNKCGREKRNCSSGCRNTIVIPYASGSSRTIAAGEAESLRMIIKMQAKDTNRQFDNVMTELNHQKSEIRRLNDMYQKMMENCYDVQSRSISKAMRSDTSRDCGCCGSKRSDTLKECGCSSNECKVVKKYDTQAKGSNNGSNDTNSPTNNGAQLKRFGPPNTAVAINMCDTCNVEINGKVLRTNYLPDHYDGDKQTKNLVNQYRKSEQKLSGKRDNSNRDISNEQGDQIIKKSDSVSTIYKNDKRYKNQKKEEMTVNKDAEFKKTENVPFTPKHKEKIDLIEVQTETEDSESFNKTGSKQTKKSYSSRVLVWLKRSWISIKNKTEECKKTHGQRAMHSTLNFCHSKAKKVATGVYKSVFKGMKL